MENELLTSILKAIAKHFEGASQEAPPKTSTLNKSVLQEERKALFVVLEPEVEDAHGDIYSEDVIEKACENFNVHCMKANLFHRVETQSANILQSYTSPVDFDIEMSDGSAKTIKKGTWLQWWQFPDTEAGNVLWDMVKSGDINGVSVGCQGTLEELEDA